MNPSLRIERSRIPRYLVGIAAVLAGVTICEGVLRTLGVFVGPSGETLVFEGSSSSGS
ncbi:hypothetical protein ACFQL4_20180 [Halosimplex aquaticum]